MVEILDPVTAATSAEDQSVALPAGLGLRRLDVALLAGLALVATGLVAPLLAPRSLFRDDAWQALATRVPLGQVFRVGVTAPGYAFVLRTWSLVAGRGNLALQVPGLVAAVVGPMGVYLLGRRLGHSRGAAVTSAVLLLTAVNQIQYAARIKPYVLDVVVAVVLLWLAHRVLDAPLRRSRWIVVTGAAVTALVFSASTVPVAVASLGVPALAMVVQPRHRRFVAIPVVCCAVYASFLGLWYLVVLKLVRTGQLSDAWLENRGRHSNGRVSDTIRALEPFFNLQSPRPVRLLGFVLACAVVVGVVSVARRRGIAVAGLLLAPIAIAAGLKFAGKVPLGTGRTDLYLYPASMLLASATIDTAAGFRWVTTRVRPAAGVLAGLVVVPFLAAAVATSPQREYPNTDARSAAAFARSHAGPTDRIVTAPELGYIYAFYAPDLITARADAASLTGFTPVVGDRRVLTLSHLLAGSPLVATRVTAELRSAALELAPAAHFWLLKFTTINDFNPIMSDALEGAGCRALSTRAWPGASATEWTCE